MVILCCIFIFVEILLYVHLPRMKYKCRLEGMYGRFIVCLIYVLIASMIISVIHVFIEVARPLESTINAAALSTIPLVIFSLNYTLCHRYYMSLISADRPGVVQNYMVSMSILPRWMFALFHPISFLKILNKTPVYVLTDKFNIKYVPQWDEYQLLSKKTLVKEKLRGKIIEIEPDDFYRSQVSKEYGYFFGKKSIYVTKT